ncbi:MAG: hypothetical protein AB7F51_17625 [Pseudorhodoplanes sp.]
MTAKQAPEREEMEALLPWHAAGTLNHSDAERVERAIAADQELARRFALVREELAETIHLNETLGAPSARVMEKLFAKIDAEEAVAPRPHREVRAGFFDSITGFIASLTPRTLALTGAAACLAILLQAGVIAGTLLKSGGGSYETASYGPVTKPAEGSFALVRFAADATAADITRLLEGQQAAVVSGPAAGGIYRIRVAVTGLPKEELAKIVKRLQDDKAVSFAAPAN